MAYKQRQNIILNADANIFPCLFDILDIFLKRNPKVCIQNEKETNQFYVWYGSYGNRDRVAIGCRNERRSGDCLVYSLPTKSTVWLRH